jgi:glycine/D-amino acid oxidase-like deaminating enzyme
MVEKMRQTIESLGGEIRFEQRVDELLIENQHVQGVVLANGQSIGSQHIVCAIGHSARDTFKMLFDKGVYIEPKPFSIGIGSYHWLLYVQLPKSRQPLYRRDTYRSYRLIAHFYSDVLIYSQRHRAIHCRHNHQNGTGQLMTVGALF